MINVNPPPLPTYTTDALVSVSVNGVYRGCRVSIGTYAYSGTDYLGFTLYANIEALAFTNGDSINFSADVPLISD